MANINDILKYVGFNIYIKRVALHLEENEFLYKELINSDVIDEDGNNLGKIIEIERGASLLIKVNGSKKFYIPYVDEYIIKFDLNNKKLYTKNAKDLIF